MLNDAYFIHWKNTKASHTGRSDVWTVTQSQLPKILPMRSATEMIEHLFKCSEMEFYGFFNMEDFERRWGMC